jgi:hypothetical protein
MVVAQLHSSEIATRPSAVGTDPNAEACNADTASACCELWRCTTSARSHRSTASFANYNATYGSLGAGIGMMMWMWIFSIVISFGAQLNSEIEHQTARDSTVDGPRPLGKAQ